MHRNLLLMGVSIGVRLLTSIVLFIILARVWGPELFGKFTLWFAVVTIITLFVSYGFPERILRDIGGNANETIELLSEIWTTRKVITIFVSVVFMLLTFIYVDSLNDILFIWLMFFSAVLLSFAELNVVPLRAINKFSEETKLVIISNIVHFVVIIIIIVAGGGLVETAFGFFVSRLIFFLYSKHKHDSAVGKIPIKKEKIQVTLRVLKKNLPFGLDSAVSTLFSQVDILLVNHFLGLASVGAYQAGNKIMRGANTFTQVIVNVHLPSLSRKYQQLDNEKLPSSSLLFHMSILGFLASACLVYGNNFITNVLFGPQYSVLSELFPLLGVLLYLRYLVAVLAVVLTVVKLQWFKVYGFTSALIVLVVSSWYLIPIYQLSGMIYSSIIATLFLNILFIIFLRINNAQVKFLNRYLLVTACLFGILLVGI